MYPISSWVQREREDCSLLTGTKWTSLGTGSPGRPLWGGQGVAAAGARSPGDWLPPGWLKITKSCSAFLKCCRALLELSSSEQDSRAATCCLSSSVSWLVAVRSGTICLAFLIHARKLVFWSGLESSKREVLRGVGIAAKEVRFCFPSAGCFGNLSLQHRLPVVLVAAAEEQPGVPWPCQFQARLRTGLRVSRGLHAGKQQDPQQVF